MRVITVSRKPLAGTVVQNILQFGTGGLGIDVCRVPIDPVADASQLRVMNRGQKTEQDGWGMNQNGGDRPEVVSLKGRWPSNVILQHTPDCSSRGCTEGCPISYLGTGLESGLGAVNGKRGKGYNQSLQEDSVKVSHEDSSGASRFFKQIGRE